MITGSLKSEIDKLWETFWTGGITNPLTVIEQITLLLFLRMIDMQETKNDLKRRRNPAANVKRLFEDEQQHLRWQNWNALNGEKMFALLKTEVMEHLHKQSSEEEKDPQQKDPQQKDPQQKDPQEKDPQEKDLPQNLHIKNLQFLIPTAALLTSAVEAIKKLPLERSDIKGDLYEYLLSKLSTAGINGQFRTPRHIIDAMIEMTEIKPTEKIVDPSCGTAGFLVRAYDYLLRTNTSPEGIVLLEDGSKVYTGDSLAEESLRKHIDEEMFHGFDFDPTMLRIAAMNLRLHGIAEPKILYQDTLSNTFNENENKIYREEFFDVVLANPPFTGSINELTVNKKLLAIANTTKTELLFLIQIMHMLKTGGRCAVVVPDGVTFGNSNAHKAVRTLLATENQLEGVVSLPSGVFKPYAGVSTAILFFTKGGTTDHVWFYDVKADGYSLDDRRNPIAENDLPSMVASWKAWKQDRKLEDYADRTQKAFVVPVSEIKEKNYDLSINKYKKVVYTETQYDPPQVILQKLVDLENEILADLKALGGML